jgi:hypothetical protein
MNEMKMLEKTERLNNINHSAIMGLAGFRRQFLFGQRCIVPKITINDRSILDYLLDDAFPGLCFSEKNDVKSLDIQEHINEVGGEYLLDLVKMSRSESFAHLFPEDFHVLWDEDAARKKYGRADVIRFFIDLENEKFLREFSKFKNADIVNIGKDAISNIFFEELRSNNDEKKPVWKEWDFSKIVKHKLPKMHKIYKAFLRYAHKKYSLLGFGLWKKIKKALVNRNAADLLLAGNRLLNKFVGKKIFKIDRLSIERQIEFLETEQEILESFRKVNNKYVPYLLTDVKTFIRQIKNRIQGLLKIFDNPDRVNHVETFSPRDRKKKKKYFYKIGQYISVVEDFNDYHKNQISGTYREKVMFLYQWIGVIRTYFTKKEVEILYGLFGKLNLPVSFDEPHKNNDNGESLILYDILGDDKYVSSKERLSWAVLFTDVFKQEFDAEQMKKFLECIPAHFYEHPPNYDNAGDFNMNYYSKQQLYKTYCIRAGIEEEQKMWKNFLIMIKKVIDSINKIRNELRRKP